MKYAKSQGMWSTHQATLILTRGSEYKHFVSISSRNGLSPFGAKPFLEPTLTSKYFRNQNSSFKIFTLSLWKNKIAILFFSTYLFVSASVVVRYQYAGTH